MSKEAFLTELAGHLKVLEKQEQQDILDEYAQHIDMKIQNGMSEEEAIGDFGPVKELAAEILEAYHVNPEYGDSSRRMRMDFESAANTAEQSIRQAGGFLKKLGKKLGQWIREVCAWVGKPVRKKTAEQTESIIDRPEQERKDAAGGNAEKRRDRTQRSGIASLLSGLGQSLRRLCCGLLRVSRGVLRWFRRLCCGLLRVGWEVLKWFLRLCWNVFWFCAAVGLGAGTIVCIFCFGMLLILCFQGYPLMGVTLMGLGGMLCGGALTGACWGLIRRKKTQEKEQEKTGIPENEEDMDEEPDEEELTDGAAETGEEEEHDQIA